MAPPAEPERCARYGVPLTLIVFATPIIGPAMASNLLLRSREKRRFMARIDAELCNGCGNCAQRCCVARLDGRLQRGSRK